MCKNLIFAVQRSSFYKNDKLKQVFICNYHFIGCCVTLYHTNQNQVKKELNEDYDKSKTDSDTKWTTVYLT